MEGKLSLLLSSDFSSLDESTQEEVYRDFYKLVYNVSFYILNDHAFAEDVVQEAFLRTIYNAPVMVNEIQLRAWIKVVTKNLTLNIIRKNNMVRNPVDVETVLMDRETNDESIESKVEMRMLEEDINNSLEEITWEHRNIIELKWKMHQSTKDMAKHLGTTEGAAKQKLYRAREALKKKLRQKRGSHNE